MISADEYVIDFIAKNVFSLGILFGILKILAFRSKNTLDDSIMGYLGGIFSKKKAPFTEIPIA